jgi:hypothetical protein
MLQNGVSEGVLSAIRGAPNLHELGGGIQVGEGFEQRGEAMTSQWPVPVQSAMDARPGPVGIQPSGRSVGQVEHIDRGPTHRGPATQHCR